MLDGLTVGAEYDVAHHQPRTRSGPTRHHLGHQRRQVGGFAVQRRMRAGQALAFQQIGHQIAHQGQVAQQCVAAGL